jgi:hypothetical protein
MRKLHIATTIAARASENYHFLGQLQKTTTFAFNGFKKLPVMCNNRFGPFDQVFDRDGPPCHSDRKLDQMVGHLCQKHD